MEECQASAVELLVMNPQNGEIMAMVNVPEFNLNEPFTLADGTETSDMERLNEMWRNACVSDTYEPGSTFKIITTRGGAGGTSGHTGRTVQLQRGDHGGGYEDPVSQDYRPWSGDLCRMPSRIPAIRCLSSWGCASVWSGIFPISASSVSRKDRD